MRRIRTKQFQVLSDMNLVWDFMVDNYGRCGINGMAAPFYEYAMMSTWMDKSLQFLNRIWFDGDKVVGFVYNESPVTDVYFNLRPEYSDLACEMMDYAEQSMPNFDHAQRMVLFRGQDAFIDEVKRRGYSLVHKFDELVLDFANELSYELPEGFHFVDPKDVDPLKLARCCWKGFNHEEKGPFEGWDKPVTDAAWEPQKQYRGVLGAMMAPGPHSTSEYDVVIANAEGEYVCFSGMWFVPQNRLAYMEPLCTIPEYRHRGLAAAALTRHYRRMKALGADHMTGGSNPFYAKLGFGSGFRWTFWKKVENTPAE